MDALEALFTRRSVRRFRPDPVERSEIEGRKLGTHPILLKASRRIPR